MDWGIVFSVFGLGVLVAFVFRGDYIRSKIDKFYEREQ